MTGEPGPCGCGCALTPETSYGFRVVTFADEILEMPLDAWQRWLVIHAGELLPSGKPRFRKVLVIVARQNGKTHVLVVLSLYWLFVERRKLVLGTSTNLDYAQESWEKAVEISEGIEELAEKIPARGGVRRTNGQNTLRTTYKSRYKIAASNRKGGRSLTVHRLILDELREHPNFKAWSAAYNAMNAVKDGQAFAITNQGDSSAVVLNSLRSAGIKTENGVDSIRTDGVDPKLGVFEWSAPLGSQADDPLALAMSNPNLETRIDLLDLQSEARRAMENGGEELAEFQTEVLCIKVPVLDPAIDAQALERCDISIGDGAAKRLKAFSLAGVRSRVAAVLDVAPNGTHASLLSGAMLANGKVRLDVVKSWSGEHALRDCTKDLPGLVAKVKPRVFGWFPSGPAAALAGSLAERKADDPRGVWPPKGVEVVEIKTVSAVCMQLAAQVNAENIEYNGDLLITAHLVGAEKLHTGDGWRFVRRGAGNCDAAYATAGVVHLALTMPPPVAPVGKQRLVVAGSSPS